jgi:hypothetical protein
MADKLSTEQALRIVTAICFVATGTPESDIAAELRPSALSLDVMHEALYTIRNACNHATDIINVYPSADRPRDISDAEWKKIIDGEDPRNG